MYPFNLLHKSFTKKVNWKVPYLHSSQEGKNKFQDYITPILGTLVSGLIAVNKVYFSSPFSWNLSTFRFAWKLCMKYPAEKMHFLLANLESSAQL